MLSRTYLLPFFVPFLFWNALLFSAPKIFVIGDSHVKAFQGIPRCSICHLGPRTMHRAGRDGFSLAELKRLGIRNGDVIVYVFGEIDVRCHIGRQRDLHQRKEEEIVHTLATNYLRTVVQNQSYVHDATSIIYNVVPPTDIIFNIEYPTYGSLEDRVRITKHLNKILHSLCLASGIAFLETYNDYCDADGVLRSDLSDGNVHIHPSHHQLIQRQLFSIIEDARRGHP